MKGDPIFKSALLVEDELNLATTLKVALKKLNIPVEHAFTLREAKEYLKKSKPEFILLDRNLPDGDGLSLCSSLRDELYSGTILVLTASGQTEDRVKGLNSGADDYLPKPFSWEELEARIRALARRNVKPYSNIDNSTQRQEELWKFDSHRLRILGPKGWVELTPLEYKLATQLIANHGTITSRDTLLKDVWGFTFLPKTRTVDHFLGRLRKHFEDNPEEPKHFLTIRGAGYKFEF